ncbi:hypothetical protein PRIPAC_78243 [Pristionchus pacificus]|uniref:Uncharacterized protein n=1 Tax=Pristionchus pacificus TaxID=54126 RepID=A0A2A6CLA3_PRIPA|nr:hypothetical protein PRIPAC_78243 [Pristionchus pacificus]|eukprot:PDM78868.1 hypothetical protein PRIPAC_31447 [Pristionchus pacificus]
MFYGDQVPLIRGERKSRISATMRSTEIVICFVISAVLCRDRTVSEWWTEENAQHECRACKDVPIEKAANCPDSGYFCDEKRPLRASVLTSDSCNCQSIACADRGWILAVNGTIVDRIRCEGREWYTTYGEKVPSTICMKEVTSTTTTSPTTTTTPTPTDICQTTYVPDCMGAPVCEPPTWSFRKLTCPPGTLLYADNVSIDNYCGGPCDGNYITCDATGKWFAPPPSNFEVGNPIFAVCKP